MADAELTDVITVAPGGIMTDEVGVITGDVEITSSYADGRGRAVCRYDGAEEWYVISDSSQDLEGPGQLPGYHEALLARYRQR